ncbi:alpha/beta fold hydrolase, partial [Mycobacterium asiaticum]
PHGRYISVSGAGHFSHEEAPQEINRHLTRFLEKVHRPRIS